MSSARLDRTWSLAEHPTTVRTRALDPVARRASFELDGGREVVVTVRREADADVVRCTREIDTGAHGLAAALVGTTMVLDQTERWTDPDDDGRVRAHLEVGFRDRPLHLDARIDIRPTETGCVYRVRGVAEARLTGVGAVVARRIVARTLTDLDRQLTAGR